MQFQSTRAAAAKRLLEFVGNAGRAYANNRNYDDGPPATGARRNVSQLSPWLHGGLLSEREVIETVLSQHSADAADKFIAEVFWRVYFKGYLEQRPGIWRDYCAGRDAALDAVDANAGLRKAYDEAVEGRTGIAAFDHWAHELVETGYLHNHARMWFASIWIFTLKLDWRLGADFFLRHLVDGDAASNTLSWRWVGGLHTKGKTYLARADNIARYTANQPGGALGAQGLTEEATPLEEAAEYPRQPLSLPAIPEPEAFTQPYALLLHDEGASHIPLDLPHPPALVIGAARPDARSPLGASEAVSAFVHGAVEHGMADAAQEYSCEALLWEAGESLSDIMAQAGVERIAVPALPTGWTHNALFPQLSPLIDDGSAVELLCDLGRATWPHAKAGFFGVKKKMPGILEELGITGSAPIRAL